MHDKTERNESNGDVEKQAKKIKSVNRQSFLIENVRVAFQTTKLKEREFRIILAIIAVKFTLEIK